MSKEYSGIITKVERNPPQDPKHYCVTYRDNGGSSRIFTIPIAETLRDSFTHSSIGKPITVTTRPNDEPAIINIGDIMVYPRL